MQILFINAYSKLPLKQAMADGISLYLAQDTLLRDNIYHTSVLLLWGF